ncbi:MAG: ribonuclease J [Alphaproteobacteria bacterium]|nr:ribonuclease J [Alphaproteobacteria bacterium]
MSEELNETQENLIPEEVVIPSDSFVMIPLGGVTEIGLNFFCYGYKGKWLIVDCGIGFPGDNLPGVETLLPDPTFIAKHKADIVGLVITHGHEDHIGAIPYLWRDLQCPIYATPFASQLIEDKLNEFALLKRVELEVVDKGALLELGPFEVEFLNAFHSIPEANMLAIRTKEGTVVHTGDWKFEDEPLCGEPMDTKMLKQLGKEGVLALVADSTNIFLEEDNETEKDVRENLAKLIKEYTKGIFVACFASNITRIESIYLAAKEAGREVCLLGRSLWRLENAARSAGYLKDVPEFLTEDEAADLPKNKVLYICTGSQGEPYSALSKLASAQNIKGLTRLEQGDVVLFSSRVIPGNETAIATLQNRLMSAGCQIVTNRDALIHVSGHPAQKDMERLYSYLKPKIAVPVHGDLMQIVEHKKWALRWGASSAVVLEEGDILEFNDGNPEILGEVPVGVLAVDGKRIVSLRADVIRQRRKMMEDGTVVATVLVDKEGFVFSEPQISSFGLLEESSDDKKDLTDSIKNNVADLSDEHRQREDLIKDAVRRTLRQFIREKYGKKPVIEIHLFQI